MNKSFPPADALISLIRRVDWVTVILTIAAVAVILGTKLLNAIIKFWEQNGEMITDKAYIFAAIVYNKGRAFSAYIKEIYSIRHLVTV